MMSPSYGGGGHKMRKKVMEHRYETVAQLVGCKISVVHLNKQSNKPCLQRVLDFVLIIAYEGTARKQTKI